ncbi:outer membrane lipoprotein [Sulfuritalea hydrogenivorans]|uniref:17 kDa surface antigen n=1 Tax=Sulfuritalea hydrogenivorans sk43H TaxID=1223802 RepID=W0SFV6_9PROT|nr:glycine zipper 2TM domain-containing protein [Sulfuritalea hydrogenivorans]BAO30154.1 17 kDa surface antigen [Sulfuritalea hydrogenivorans sk43H]
MEATHVSPATSHISHTHPLLLVAAASVTVLSLAGVATLAGWMPGPHGAEPAKLAAAAPQATVATLAPPISVQQTVTLSQAKPAAAKPAERTPASIRRTASGTYGPAVAVSPAPTYAGSTPAPATICRDCGVVQAVNEVVVEPKGSGGGAVAGGLVGGIIGNQIGKGATRDIATVLGAVGGAYAGNHIEKSTKESKRYDIVVRFEDGSTRTFSSDSPPAWHRGDRVRLQNDGLIFDGGRSGARDFGAA